MQRLYSVWISDKHGVLIMCIRVQQKSFSQTAGVGDDALQIRRRLRESRSAAAWRCCQGVVISDEFSVAQHVQRLTTSSAQTLYALRVLRCHGLSDAPLQNIYRASCTVIARLTYAASAWRGFTKASDRQRINSVIDRARRLGYCAQNLQNFDELCDAADDELFSKAAQLSNHVLHELLPPP